MDAVEFLKAYRRICDINACIKCPLWVDEHCVCMMNAKVFDKAQFDESKVVSIVEQWVKEHPVKTRQSEFLKMFPNAPLYNGVISICPRKTDKTFECKHCGNCPSGCYHKYWLQEIQEEE